MPAGVLLVAKVEISLSQVNPATMTVIDGAQPIRLVATTPEIQIDLVSILRGPKGDRGPQGQTGAPGASGDVSFVYPAAAPVSGHRVVTLNAQGKAIYASAAIAAHANRILGVTTNAASADSDLNVKKFGELVEPSWNWQLDKPVYLDADGFLTQTPPEAPGAKFSVVVGFPVSAATLFISIGIPITLIA